MNETKEEIAIRKAGEHYDSFNPPPKWSRSGWINQLKPFILAAMEDGRAAEIRELLPMLKAEIEATKANEPVRAKMQAIAKGVDGILPKGYGFFVLCFQFGVPGPVEYASNARREDVVEAMKEFIELNPMQDPSKN